MEAKQVRMIVTGPGGIKLSAIVVVDTDDGVEALGSIQSDFFWENFTFDFEDETIINQPDGYPVNFYQDVERIA